jgi:hypothetical protein
MKAILTKYLGPTDHRGSRVKASDGDNSVILPWRSEWDHNGNHDTAAIALCRRLEWGGKLCRGGLRQGGQDTGNVYVWVTDDETMNIANGKALVTA